MTGLSPQTLRYYHQQDLLIPAEIGESGYRGYTFDQTHQALLIMTLRNASVSIDEIRTILDAPDLLPEALSKQQIELTRKRARENDAMTQAWRLSRGWPQAETRHNPATTAIIKQIAGEASAPASTVLPQHVCREAENLRRELIDAGMPSVGSPWCQYALRTLADKQKIHTSQGPDWLIAVDLPSSETLMNRLPANTDILHLPGDQELILQLPKKPTMVAYAAAVEYLLRTALVQELMPDFSRLRYTLEQDHVELALAVAPCEPG